MTKLQKKAFQMRIDPKLWDALEAMAESELRSVNGQIEYILREAVKSRMKAERRHQKALELEKKAG